MSSTERRSSVMPVACETDLPIKRRRVADVDVYEIGRHGCGRVYLEHLEAISAPGFSILIITRPWLVHRAPRVRVPTARWLDGGWHGGSPVSMTGKPSSTEATEQVRSVGYCGLLPTNKLGYGGKETTLENEYL